MFDSETTKLFKQTILLTAENIREETNTLTSADDAMKYALAIKNLAQAYKDL